MSDIVERLWAYQVGDALYREAADEIERLRGLLANSEMTVNEVIAANERLTAALLLAEKALTLRGPGWPLDEVRAALEGKP